ncbi:DUF3060 domain-containing protein [Tsuneonella sp. CC-YZS046]|uniref:DUF3060 domain-containing protein n=1 Tax=Tsuneonella sp. CC-YZS046 TaxID=3042152 RepID=UPI002D780BDB|nr:DUF3060 domain-containing protein [Tsuneonella sp. CC-YZS046]WRO65412.1 DUF3060 domain-containing protein [Tsuneonella sp. CC-YZS046]
MLEIPMRFAHVLAIASISVSAPVVAQANFTGAGEISEMDCDGGTANITGASNTMTITGNCTQLVIEGAGNRVRVSLAPKGVIQITGASNTVVWTTPDGSKAQVRVTGAGNRISQGR